MKQRNERSQRFNLNSSEVKQDSERSQIFHCNNCDEKKQRSELCQIFNFKGSAIK